MDLYTVRAHRLFHYLLCMPGERLNPNAMAGTRAMCRCGHWGRQIAHTNWDAEQKQNIPPVAQASLSCQGIDNVIFESDHVITTQWVPGGGHEYSMTPGIAKMTLTVRSPVVRMVGWLGGRPIVE